MNRFRRSVYKAMTACVLVTLVVATSLSVVAKPAEATTAPPELSLNVLLIGSGPTDPTTAAWQAALTSEGVAYTMATATGTYGAETVTLPALTSGTIGNFNGVVIADSPSAFAAGQLTALFSYESTDQVRQIDGYSYPTPALGQTDVSTVALDGTTGQLTAAGLAALPGLKGTIPFDTGTSGYPATVVAGTPFTPWIQNSAGNSLGGVYQHPSGDPQAGVSELALNFAYNANQLQWMVLAPGLINWVTQDTHLGLERNYFGQDVDDNFIADNEWSSQYQCTPAATEPDDTTCPTAVQGAAAGSAPGVPADVQMSATDVAYVVAWEQQTGIKLNLAFNGVGACTAPTAAAETSAVCTGSVADPGGTYTDPGQTVDATYPNDQGLVNALLADKADFNWVNHTWSHQFLGCIVWQPQALTSVTANATGGTLAAGSYSYEITAATAYGESEPSVAQSATVAANGSVTLDWPDATNGTGTGGTAGPTLAQEEANHTGGTGFWGYNIYRENPGTTTYGLIGQVAENGTAPTYTYTDTGAVATPGAAPSSSSASGPFPTATNPGIDCSSAANSWDPATSTSPDSSIEQEIGMDQAFASANALPNFSSSVVVTGEHSGIENPNMPAALAGVGVNTFASDASRQPTQYSLTSGSSTAISAPRYPSNIYYNASNWPDQLNEYNTLYVAPGTNLGNATYPTETGHCDASSATTCLTTPATEATVLASESRIMLSHVLNNDPRVGYAHQTDLIGPATQNGADYGYTLLSLLNSMQTQYNTWDNTNTPLVQMTDGTESQVLGLQSAWAAAQTAGTVKGTEQNGTVTITNTGTSAVSVPATAPTGTLVGTAAFGQAYGGELSDWTSIPAGGSLVLTEHVAPTIISANTASSIVGAPFTTTIYTTGEPAAAITETGALPSGITLTDNGNGTATLAGTAAAKSGGSYPIVITATNTAGSTTQAFTLTNSEAPTITSPATATFYPGSNGTYTVTTTGFPAATITETGTLPAGLAFSAPTPATGSATISGTTTAAVGTSDTVTISATNSSGSTATLALVITVAAAGPPTITSGTTAYFNLGQTGSVAVTSTAGPTATLTETGALPAGLTFADQLVAGAPTGTALISGTPTAAGVVTVVITAANGTSPNATQTLSIQVASKPAVTSASSATATAGKPFSFTVTAGGYPAPSLGWSGTLPPGLSFKDNGNGTATISGTPTGAWLADLGILATNASGTVTNAFTLTVVPAPAPAPPPPATTSTSLAGGGRLAATPDGLGYWVVGSNGSVTNYGSAVNYGSMAGKHLNQPIVGIAATPDGKGYWLVATDGGIFSFGDAQFYGSTGSIKLNKPIVGITSTLDGKGYWMVASDGGVFSFGDAAFHGSTGSIKLNQPVVGMSPTPSGKGYWLVASDGGIFTFGDAAFHGSTGSIRLNQPIMGMAPTRDGHGYWLVAGDGGIFTFGDASFHGSGGSSGNPAVGMIVSPTHAGYSLILANGARDNFGF
jgi:hypothetical protein